MRRTRLSAITCCAVCELDDAARLPVLLDSDSLAMADFVKTSSSGLDVRGSDGGLGVCDGSSAVEDISLPTIRKP